MAGFRKLTDEEKKNVKKLNYNLPTVGTTPVKSTTQKQPSLLEQATGGSTDSRFSLPGTQSLLSSARLSTSQSIEKGLQKPQKIQSDWADMPETDLISTISGNIDSLKEQFSQSKAGKAADVVESSALKGMSSFNTQIAKTLNLPAQAISDLFGIENKFPTAWLAKNREQAEQVLSEDAAAKAAEFGKGGEIASNLISTSVQAVPAAVLSVLSGGSSAVSQLAPQASGISGTIASGLQSVMSNPMTKTTFLTTVGSEYEQAKASGASAGEALVAAIGSSLVQAGIESGGGLEKLPQNLRTGDTNKWLAVLRSGVEEAIEEPAQNIVSGAINKGVYDTDRPVFSTTDETAVINPAREAESAAYAFGSGLLLGSGQNIALSALNRSRGQSNTQPVQYVPEQAETPTQTQQGSNVQTVQPASVLDKAAAEFNQRGAVSNNTATAILNDPAAVAELQQNGLTLTDSMTQSQRRAAVKETVARMQGPDETFSTGAQAVLDVLNGRQDVEQAPADTTTAYQPPEAVQTVLDVLEGRTTQEHREAEYSQWGIEKEKVQQVKADISKSGFSGSDMTRYNQLVQKYGQQNVDTAIGELLDDNVLKLNGGGQYAPVDPMAHIENRDAASVSSRRQNAFQYDNPELHPYMSEAAYTLIGDVANTTRGERFPTDEYGQRWTGVKRNTTPMIAEMKDTYGMSYDQIIKGAEDIIADQGQENNANAKRVETFLDDMLVNGHQAITGENIPPNAEYIQLRNQIPGADSFQQQAAQPGETTSVGAAPAGFNASAYNEWVNNAQKLHETGEKAVRNASVPTEDLFGNKTMKTGQTIMEAQATPDKRIGTLENMYVSGALSYVPTVNADLAADAESKIISRGWNELLTDWTSEVRKGKVKPELVAMGAQLLNNMGNSNATAAQYADLVSDYSLLLHNAGQSLQAARILKMLTPEGKLYALQRGIDSINEQIKSETDISLDETLLQEYRQAETDEQRDAILDRMKQDVADKMPSTLSDKWTALRYVNMLGNFKTQGRNLIGNVAMYGLKTIKDEIATGVEFLASGATGGKIQRTKSAVVGKSWMDAAKNDFSNIESAALGSGRYEDSAASQILRDINDRRTIFKNNGDWGTSQESNVIARGARKITDVGLGALEVYRKATNWATNSGDMIFLKRHYARALAGYLKANGVDVAAFSEGNVDAELLDRARSYALKEAQDATFRDNNTFSNWVSRLGRQQDTPKPVRVIAEGVAPFRKTPANVLVRAYEYSPLGFIDTALTASKAKSGNASASDIINSASRALTGTGLLLLGVALRAAGFMTAGLDEDDRDIDSLLDSQDYSINIGGKSYTMDWLSPLMLPVFMGGVLQDVLDDKELTWSDADNVIGQFADPLLNMSMLSGIDSALSNIKYSDNGLIQMAASFGLSYLTQGLTNTMLGQVERSSEQNRTTTYIDPDSPLPDWLQRALGSASAKIPGWDFQQTEYLNEFGQTESNGPAALRAFENFISPGFVGEPKTGQPVFQELQNIYNSTGETPFPGTSAPKSVKVDGVDYVLNQTQKEQYQKTLGGYYYDTASDVVSMDSFKNLPASEQSSALATVKELATERAKSDLYKELGLEYTPSKALQTVESGVPASDFSIFDAIYGKMDKEDTENRVSNSATAIMAIEKVGVSDKDTAAALWASKNSSTSAAKNPYSGAMGQSGLTVDEIVDIISKDDSIENQYQESADQKKAFIEYLDGLDLSPREYNAAMFQADYQKSYNYETMTDKQKTVWDNWGSSQYDMDQFLKLYRIMSGEDTKDEAIDALYQELGDRTKATRFYTQAKKKWD